MVDLITENLDLWSSAYIAKKTAGRGSSTRSDAYGIQKLRELILELAVRGKLVPQDPTDEPASVLLKKIEQEKEQLIQEEKIKSKEKLAKISEQEKTFILPSSWIWTKLGNISANIHYGYTASANQEKKEVRLVRITDIQNNTVNWDTVPGCEIDNEKVLDYQLENNDLLIARTGGTIGKSYLVTNIDITAVFASYLIRVKHLESMSSPYIKIFLGSQFYWKQLYANSMGTGQPNVNGNALKNLVVPLPPFEEQKRIISKINELMLVCDHLEEQQNENTESHQILVETLLNTLTSTKDAQEFQESWNRITEHFDTLFTTEQSIDTLKQTILQLAVMGKLVPQDPNDEPATVLLEKITQEKDRLIKEGKIKKQAKLSEISEDEKIFALPHGWEWCYLQNIVYILGDGLHGTPEYSPNEKYFFINGNNLKDGKIIIKQDTKTVSYDEYLKYKKDLNKNSVLVSINGTLGNVAFYNNEDIILGKSACYFNLVNDIDKSFIKILIESPIFYSYAFHNATGSTIKNLGLGAMNTFVIALPPVAEQHRIVAKVDELMALCDVLKQRIEDARTTQIHLADAIVEQAVK
jgi:type I restriction enzyme, S subunit